VIEIPGYRILRPLGQGGMATVYLAVQESLGREVALKVLAPTLAQDPVACERFLREARTAAKLHHPHIIAVHDVGVHNGTPFMSISYESGGTVAQTTRAQEDPKFAFRIVRDIAEALDYAHRQGVVHRDVKPENILLRPDGNCVLSDFGIAHAVEAQTGLTREGTSVGTPHYMSPEQLRGEHADGRSDLYSLGVVFYQLLTGDLPYQGTDGWAIGMQHIMAPIPKLPARLAYLQELLDGLLAKEPAARLQSGAEVVRWIDARVSLQTPAMTMAMPTPRGITSAEKAAQVSIAVLPFMDLSQGKDQEYFVDGLTDEILNLLARVPRLHVASRTATATFRGRNASLAEMGRELKVASVLEGSVRKAGERVRVSVQLINVADGYNLWSETYNRDLTDVFAVQEEIAQAVIEALREKLLPADPDSPAQELARQLQLARERLAGESREDAEAAVAAFAKVLAIDPAHTEAKYGSAAAQRTLARLDAAVAAEQAAVEAREREAAAARAAEEAREQAAAERAAAEQREREAAARAEEEARRREAAERAAAEAAERERVAAERAAEEQRQREAAALAAQQAREREAAARAAEEQRQREAAARAAEEQRQREAAAHAAEEQRQREAAQHAAEEAADQARQQQAAELAAARAAEEARHEAEERARAEEQRQREAAARVAAEHQQREAAALRAAEEQRQRDAAQQAAAEARRADADAREAAERAAAEAAERAAAAAAAPLSTIVIPIPGRGAHAEPAAPPPPAAPPADKIGGARAPDPAERALAFAQVMDSHPKVRPEMAPPMKRNPLPLVLGGLAVLALVGGGAWWFMGQRAAADLAQCKSALDGAQALLATDAGKAADALAPAGATCTGADAERLHQLQGDVELARTREQTCLQAEAQAGKHLEEGQPALAGTVLDGARTACAARAAFVAADTRANNAAAEARRLFVEASAQLKAGDVRAADTALKKALATDANLPGTELMRADIDQRLAKLPKETPAPTPATPTPAPAVAQAPPKPEPKPEAKPEAKPPVTPPKPAPTTAALTPPPAPRPVAPAPTPAAPIVAPGPTAPASAPAPMPTAAAPPPPPSPAAKKAALVPISTPSPPFPDSALRARLSGYVVVTYTVGTDGRVGNMRILESQPRGVFDRTVQQTLGRWRYEPPSAPREITHTFDFEQ